MKTIPTPAVEREVEKRARDLHRGDWLVVAWWHLANVRYVEVYTERGRERVCVLYRDRDFNRPVRIDVDADLRVTLAATDEIPEDAFASGRELDDEPGLLPSWVEEHSETGRADHG